LACQIENVQLQDLQYVELWQTEDAGATWRRVAQIRSPEIDFDRPFQIETEHDGLFGFRLSSYTKRGDGERPPRSGETAEVWAFVDTAPPQVEITHAAIAPAASGEPTTATLVVDWHAHDATLTDRGVSLAYSDKPGGPWTTFAAGLANRQQHYRWPLEGRLPQRLYIQVEARDKAGNVGRHGFADPVIVPSMTGTGRR
jgi:hypothetical protein